MQALGLRARRKPLLPSALDAFDVDDGDARKTRSRTWLPEFAAFITCFITYFVALDRSFGGKPENGEDFHPRDHADFATEIESYGRCARLRTRSHMLDI